MDLGPDWDREQDRDVDLDFACDLDSGSDYDFFGSGDDMEQDFVSD